MKTFKEFRRNKEVDDLTKLKGKNHDEITGKEESGIPFGWSLAIDLYDAKGPLMENSEKSAKAIKKFLIELVKELKMEVGGEPVCLMSDKEDMKKYPDKIGASAWICLITSGIQLHTIVPKHFACVDIFSCKEFDPEMVDEFLKKSFQTKKLQSSFIKRGVKYNEGEVKIHTV